MANEEMVPDNEMQPVVAAENEPVVAAEPEVAAPGGEAEPAVAAATPEEPAAEPQSQDEIEDWREKQIARQHKKIKDLERERADMRAMLEGRAQQQPQAPAEGQQPRAEAQPAVALSEDEINRRAAAIAEQNRYQERLTSLNDEGEKTFGQDWGKSLTRLTQIGDGTMPDLPWIMNALPDKAAKLLVDLGKNPAEMLRISELPVERRQAEYFRKAMSQPAPTTKKPSAAPAPVEPLKPRTQPVTELRDNMSDEEWHTMRAQQREARRAQMGRR